jgi:D-glycero-D-manno-heptose 1,7-bisphosphate phosphatase
VRAGRAPTGLTAVFLDRDGVINRKAPEGEYVTSWEGFAFLPGALDGLRLLAASPLAVIVATNQRGVALGRMTEEDLDDIHRRMGDAVAESGGRIDAVYYCPHGVGCRCRKPEVGMFEDAARDFGLRLGDTAVIGDSHTDMLAAERIGAVRVLVGDRDPAVTIDAGDLDYAAGDLAAAARWLLGAASEAAV